MLLYECLACRVPPTSGGECIELDRTVHAVLPPTECTCGCDMYARAMVLAHHCTVTGTTRPRSASALLGSHCDESKVAPGVSYSMSATRSC